MSLMKEFVNQTDLKKADGSDAGKTDVQQKAGAGDVQFSLMRNTINSDGKISGSDVNDYLEKAHDLNDEVDTVLYGMETSDGEVVKVYVNAQQAEAFEAELKKLLGMEDDIEEVVNDLATRFDIVDVIWPKGAKVTDENGDEVQAPEDEALDMGSATDDDDADDDDMDVIASAEDDATTASGEDESVPGAAAEEPAKKSKKPASSEEEEEAPPEDEAEEDAEDKEEDAEDKEEAKKIAKKVVKKLDAKSDDKHSKLKGLGKGLKGEKTNEETDADTSERHYREGFAFGQAVKSGKHAKLRDDEMKKYSPAFMKGYNAARGVAEAKLQPGWYVMDGDDKSVAGPLEETAARELCKKKGGDAKGFTVTCVSDHAARKSNEGVDMTIGKKFLERYLAEGKQLDEVKRDVDGFRDNIDIPGLDQTSPLLAGQLPLAKLATQVYILLGVPVETLERKVRAVKEGAASFAEKMRTNPTLKKTVIRLKDALGESKGFVRKMDEAASAMPQDELMLQGSKMLAQLEKMLVAMELAPAVVKMAMRQNREAMTDTAISLTRGVLRNRFAALASELGVDLASVNVGDKAVAEELELDEAVDPMGANLYADAVMALVASLGVPDNAFARNARMVLGRAFQDMKETVNTNALINRIKTATAQFEKAKVQATRPQTTA